MGISSSARIVFLVAAAFAAAAFIGGSVAQAGPAAPARLDARSSSAEVSRYLRSLGVDPAGVVVQRGARNYAGSGCPGTGWSCTSSTKVLQLTTGGINISRCTTSGGSSTITRAGSGGNVSCVIVQSSTSGANSATCQQVSVTGVPGAASQECRITQTSVSGANTATVDQELFQGPLCLPLPVGPSADQVQTGTQYASIVQSSGSGAGKAFVDQDVAQCASRLTTTTVSQAQTTHQEFAITQAPAGFDPEAPACPGVTGTLLAQATQAQHQLAYAPKGTGGSQAQTADLIGHVDQCSADKADYTVRQSESQRAVAPLAVGQTQVGPFRCCSFQGVNPADTCKIVQEAVQTGHANAQQTESISARAGGTTTCTSTASATQNGTTNSSTGSSTPGAPLVNEGLLTCTNGSCITETALAYTGATTGDYADAVTLSGKLTELDGGAPVPGKPVTLRVGTQSCAAVTDAGGNASCSVTLDQPSGAVTAGIDFAGDTAFGASTASVPFTVTTEEVVLLYTGPTYGKKGKTITVSAKLKTHEGPGITGRTLTFTLGSGASARTCSAVTSGAYGTASCALTLPTVPCSTTIKVSFAGDAYYDAATRTTGFTVKSY